MCAYVELVDGSPIVIVEQTELNLVNLKLELKDLRT